MKTKGDKKVQVNVVTMGCSKNQADSEWLLTQLKGNHITATHEAGVKSNVVVINTCGFIESARQESIDMILQYTQAKEEGLVKKVYVTGCLSERYKDSLPTEIPEVDAWFGTRDMSRLLKQLNADYKHELVGERILTNPSHYAYLKISEGCDRPCSFCAIPLMRGKHQSVPMETLVKEAQALQKQGVKELILIAQDSTFYGLDLYKKRCLDELLLKLSDVGFAWIRLHYAFPSNFPLAVLDVMKERKNICHYLDIPIQHSADAMLQKMRRGITRQKTIDLLNTMRDAVPDIAIRTTLMTGFPGETEQDFADMMDFVTTQKFDRLGVFTYSHEEGTHAFGFADDVPQEIKEQRMNALMDAQQEISLQKNEQKVGQVLPIMIDKKEQGVYIGRTEYDSPEVDNEVWIQSSETMSVGTIVQAKIVSATEYDLTAELL